MEVEIILVVRVNVLPGHRAETTSNSHDMQIDPEELKKTIEFAYRAHQEHSTNSEFRQDKTVPYIAHPLWCAMVLLNDDRVPLVERQVGYQALLLHDVLEDTSLPLPDGTDPVVAELVQDMTYASWEEELVEVPKKSSLVKLMKLIDKAATMYDESIRKDAAKRRQWVEFTQYLLKETEKHYGDIRTVGLVKGILSQTDW